MNRQSHRDVAIIGMSAMFAGAPDLRTYWHNILAGLDQVREASERWSNPYYDSESSDNARIYTRRGGFLGDNIEFDPTEFGIMPKGMECADADHFLALRLSFDALRDAGYEQRPFDRKRTGIILGRGTYINRSYNTLLLHGQVVDQVLSLIEAVHENISPATIEKIRRGLKESLPAFTGDSVPNLVPNVITGRIANRLNLMGPNYIVDAACASSLIAIELAASELNSGRCDMVLSGGVHCTTPPQLYMMFCQLGALSRSDLRPFDAAAEGTLLGEGLGIVVLKRLADAERDGDRIYAIVKGAGSSSDGRAVGLLAPNFEGQVLALERAYADANVPPETVDLIEAHGTGTPVGDYTEIQTLRKVFGERDSSNIPRCAIGSVKSMIGHCIPAAGVAGLIKTALALHEKIIPPTLCSTVNPALQMDNSSLYVNTKTRPWIHDGRSHPRRAGVNAFGFGGVNAHTVLEEYIAGRAETERTLHSRWPSEIFLFAAPDRASLIHLLREVRHAISEQPAAIADIAYAYRKHGEGAHRLAIVCDDCEELGSSLNNAINVLSSSEETQHAARQSWLYRVARDPSERWKVAFLFPGEGGQHANMLTELCIHVPSVRRWFDRLDAALSGIAPIPPSRIIFPPPTCTDQNTAQSLSGQLESLEMGSAAVFAASMAVYELLANVGIKADAMVGHSSGEGAALVASGIVRFANDEELRGSLAMFYRAYREMTETGMVPRGMALAVGGVPKSSLFNALRPFNGSIHVALENCPNQTVIIGGNEEISNVREVLKAEGAICVPLAFDRAYHTPEFLSSEASLSRLYEALNVTRGHTPLYSCVTTDPFPEDTREVRSLATRQWFSPVRFQGTIEKLYNEGFRIFVEVGPGNNLTGFVRDILHRRRHRALAANNPKTSSLTQFLNVLAEMFTHGANINLDPLFLCRFVTTLPSAAGRRSSPTAFQIDLNLPMMRLAGQVTDEVRSELKREQAPSVQASPSPADARLAGLLDHFDLMQKFLESQERVMNLIEPRSCASPVSDAAAVSTKWPLLGSIVERDADHIVCERCLQVHRDRFLRDHTLGSAPSIRQPDLLALPVVPFTMCVEIVAEAAHCLADGSRTIIELLDLRGYQWLALDRGTLDIRIVAQYGTEKRDVQVRIFDLKSGADAKNPQLVFEGRAILANAFPHPPAAAAFELLDGRASHYTPSMLYGAAGAQTRYGPMFHGRRFQCVKHIGRWGCTGVEATMMAGETADMFGDAGRPSLQTDPILLDGAGQLIGYWVAERFGVDLTFFPFALRRLRLFGTFPPTDSEIASRARIRVVGSAGQPGGFEFVQDDGRVSLRINEDAPAPVTVPPYRTCRTFPPDARIEADFELLDSAGRILAIIEGWQDRYFSIPHKLYCCRLRPDREYLSESWLETAFAPFCRTLRLDDLSCLDTAWGIWKRVLANIILSERERGVWYGLPEKGTRRSQWLLGRVVAKDAVREWALARHGLSLAPADIEVLTGTLGQPEVHCAYLEPRELPVVSISHNQNYAIAVAGEPRVRMGVDLTQVTDVRCFDALEKVFCEDELNLLNQVSLPGDVAMAAFWAAREAAGKADGTGLQGNPQAWSIVNCDKDGTHIAVQHELVFFQVRVWVDGHTVVAICSDDGKNEPVVTERFAQKGA